MKGSFTHSKVNMLTGWHKQAGEKEEGTEHEDYNHRKFCGMMKQSGNNSVRRQPRTV